MNTYTATFASGITITRKSEREYGFAWEVTDSGEHDAATRGFAATWVGAAKAAAQIGYRYRSCGRSFVKVGPRVGRQQEIVATVAA